MIDERIRDVLSRRMAIEPEDASSAEECIQEEISILCEDIDQTIDYFEKRCSAEEFVWLSEVFEEVQSTLKSEKLRQCLLSTADRFPDETKEYNIRYFIDDTDYTDDESV